MCKVEARSGAGEERYEKGVRGRSNVGLGARCGLRLLCAFGTWSADRVHVLAERGKIEGDTVGEEGMSGVFTGGIVGGLLHFGWRACRACCYAG